MPTRKKGRSGIVNFQKIFMMPAGSSCFFVCGYPAFFPTESSLGTRTVLRPQKFLKSNLETESSRIYYRKAHPTSRLVCKDPMFFLFAFISRKWKIYNLWKSFIFCLTTPTLRCKLGLIKIDEQKSNHESGRKRANEGVRFAAKAWWSASGRWNSEQNRNSRVSALRIEGVGINCQQLEWYRDQSFLEC